MSHIYKIIALMGFVLSVEPAFGLVWTKDSVKKINDRIQVSGLKQANLGLSVSYVDDGARQALFELNAEKKMTPASLTKLVTGAAALDLFPQEKRLKTRLMSDGKVEGGVLRGNLYFVGGGDPGFVSEDLWVLVNHFVRTGIQVIEGDIVVDDTLFDKERYDPGRDPSRVDRAYDAPVGALSFNWNSVNIFIRPGEPGEKAHVFADPQSSYIILENKTSTVAGSGKNVRVKRVALPKQNRVVVSGNIGTFVDEVVKYKSITDPALWSGQQLLAFLRRRGLEVGGKIVSGKVPAGAHNLAEVESKPVSEMVKDMMKFSNNYVAEMLTKNISVVDGQVPGRMSSGIQAMNKYLVGLGIPKSNFHISSPSGLSRHNKFRPVDLTKLLEKMAEKFKSFPEYLVAFPIAGIDGTLKKRMNGTPAEGWVRAKTGLLNGVVGLAGYVGRPNGSVLQFAFVFNGPSGKENKAKKLFDEIAAILAKG